VAGLLSTLRGDKPKDDKPAVEIPQADEAETALIAQVQTDYEDSKSDRQEHADKWQRIHDYFIGDQWDAPDDADDDWMPRPVTNIVENYIDTAHANMTSGKVAISITERRPGYAEVAKKLQDVISATWDGLDMDAKLRNECEYIRPEVGTVVFKSPWNPNRNNGKGDIDCSIVHPLNVFFDPNISNPRELQMMDFIIYVMPKTRSYVLRRYSKEKDKLCRFTRKELDAFLQAESASDVEYEGENDATTNRDKIMLYEAWYRDEEGKLQVAWLANWRVLKASADDKEMAKNGFYKHGKHPTVIAHYKPRPKSLYGRSEVESLISFDAGRTDGIQDCVNILDQKVLVAAALEAIGQVVYRHGKIKNPEKITAEPGLKIAVKESVREDIDWRKGAGISQFILQWRDKKIEDSQRVTAQWDVARGEPAGGRRTAAESLARTEQALKPLNDRVMTLNDALAELIELWIEHLAEFGYKREYEISTPEGPRIIEFDPKVELFEPGTNKADTEPGEDDSSSRRIHFNVKVDVGADLVLTKAFMYELAFGLWDRKTIPLRTFMAMMPDFPGKAQAIAEMEPFWKAQLQVQPTTPTTPTDEPTQEATLEGAGLDVAAFIDSLPEDVQTQLMALPEGERDDAIATLYIQSMQAGMQGQVAQ
jgi:hypothetical protein